MSDFLGEYFSTTRTVPVVLGDLGPVGDDVMRYFAAQGYDISGTRLAGGGWHISIHKGDWFRAVLGLKTALNIEIERVGEGTRIKAGIGIFELQVLPSIVAVFVFAPVILGQIWGIIQQNQLDEEAVRIVEDRLSYYSGTSVGNVGPAHDTARYAAERELNGPG